jgi:hypothetical protein
MLETALRPISFDWNRQMVPKFALLFTRESGGKAQREPEQSLSMFLRDFFESVEQVAAHLSNEWKQSFHLSAPNADALVQSTGPVTAVG